MTKCIIIKDSLYPDFSLEDVDKTHFVVPHPVVVTDDFFRKYEEIIAQYTKMQRTLKKLWDDADEGSKR